MTEETSRPEVWPAEIRLEAGGRRLRVAFTDGRAVALPAEYLRVESPSAEVQGHGPGERRTVGGKRGVAIRGVEPVGHYAVRLVFDDGHDTGLYTWETLSRLGTEEATRWPDYLARLDAKGLSRDRPGEG